MEVMISESEHFNQRGNNMTIGNLSQLGRRYPAAPIEEEKYNPSEDEVGESDRNQQHQSKEEGMRNDWNDIPALIVSGPSKPTMRIPSEVFQEGDDAK